jgi:SAM-dependent methyltransferase
VLDVATGTGHVAVAMAQAVGPNGRVMGIDLSEAMLQRAEANIRKMRLDNVDLHVMDAEALEFRKGYFHAAVCSFGLFFLPDMARALREWSRVIRPGGRVVFSVFGEAAFQPLLGLLLAQLSTELGGEPPGAALLPARRVGDEAQCLALMEQAGLEARRVERLQLGYHLRDARDWAEILAYTSLSRLLDVLPPERKEPFRETHLAAVEGRKTDQGIWLDVESLVAVGTKPLV